jgi:glutathione peroxidase
MSVHDFTVSTADGMKKNLADYKGKVLLIVNTASKCGHTPQYAGLQKLHEDYADKGFMVLGFPSNQFKNQEPGTDAEIQEFCQANYGVTFPVFAKIDVNGDTAHPLYKFLTRDHGDIKANPIDWNFAKFLIGPDGRVRQRYAPNITPELVASDIDHLFAEEE